MHSLAVIPSELNHVGLRVLCAVGSFAGVAITLFGLGIGRKARSSPAIQSEPAELGPICDPRTVEGVTAPQIVRLSAEPGALRSSEMTQQQRIAAALGRAGIAGPAWDDPNRQHTATAVMEHPPEPAKLETYPVDSQSAGTGIHSGVRKITLLVGLMLLIGSVTLLLAVH